MAKVYCSYKTLPQAIAKIFDNYRQTVEIQIDEIGDKVAKKGRKAVSDKASTVFKSRKGERKYARGWRVKHEVNRMFISYEIHNASQPQLTHLLEEGHEIRGMFHGHYDGVKHIEPVADMLAEEFEKEVINAIQRDS